MATKDIEENIAQAISDFDDIEAAIAEQGVEVPYGTDTSEYGNLIRSIPRGSGGAVDLVYDPESENAQSGLAVAEALSGLPIQYVTSPDADGNTVYLRSLESGTYVLKGSFKPYDGNNTDCRFSSNLLVNVVKGTLQGVPTSHIQIFYPVHNVVQFVDVTDSTYKRTDIKLNDLAEMATVEEMLAAADKAAQNLYGNAIKATASGEVIRVDDVSPIEHTAKVKVSGKNLYFNNATKTTNVEGTLTCETVAGKSEFVLNGATTTETSVQLSRDIQLKAGTYTVSLHGTNIVDSNKDRLYLAKVTGGVVINYIRNNETKTFTIEEDTTVLAQLVFGKETTYENTTCYIQIEAGDTATSYEPYIDPTTVTLTRCGKNLFPTHITDYENDEGTTVKVNDNGSLTVHKVSGNTPLTLNTEVFFPKGTYVLSNGLGTGNLIYLQAFSQALSGSVGEKVIEWEGGNTKVYLYAKHDTEGDITLYPQIEAGDTATSYEPYGNRTAYTPAADGTCEVVSVSPSMTLSTDTLGVNIDLEYNQDNNAAMNNVRADLRELDKVTAELSANMGDVETALDSIITMQQTLIGGESV